ncbi:unnamed protein product [Ixodes pacificus]
MEAQKACQISQWYVEYALTFVTCRQYTGISSSPLLSFQIFKWNACQNDVRAQNIAAERVTCERINCRASPTHSEDISTVSTANWDRIRHATHDSVNASTQHRHHHRRLNRTKPETAAPTATAALTGDV